MISIIVPVYQAAEYLEICLHSLQEQTYQDMEVILINDGSTDESGEICERFSASDKRFFVFHQKNAGVSAARNLGLEKAQGDWIGFVDADDWVHPDMYRRLATLLERNVQLAVCGFTNDWENVRLETQECEAKYLSEEQALRLFFTDYHFQMAIWNKLYRRELIESGEPLRFDTRLTHGEDGLWLCRYLCRCKKIAWSDQPLYGYRLTQESAMRNQGRFNQKKLSVFEADQQMIEIVTFAGKAAEVQNAAKAHSVSVAVGLYMEALEKEAEDRAMLEEIHRTIRKDLFAFWKETAYPLLDRFYGIAVGICPQIFRFVHKSCKSK